MSSVVFKFTFGVTLTIKLNYWVLTENKHFQSSDAQSSLCQGQQWQPRGNINIYINSDLSSDPPLTQQQMELGWATFTCWMLSHKSS